MDPTIVEGQPAGPPAPSAQDFMRAIGDLVNRQNALTEVVQNLQAQRAAVPPTEPHVGESRTPSLVTGILAKDMKPPPFGTKESEDFETWTFLFETYMNVVNPLASSNQWVQIASLFLRGQAAEWFRERSKANQAPRTWEEMKTALTQIYIPIGRDKVARDKLARTKQRVKDSLNAYVSYIRRLFLAIPGIDENEKVDRFVRGLKPELQKEVFLKEPTTFEEAVAIAAKYEALQGRVSLYTSSTRTSAGPTPMELGAITHRSGPSHKFKDPPRKDGGPRKPPDGDRPIGPCWACHEMGHIRSNCPNRSRKTDPKGK
jgi:hypothetical protein